ncbi:hypothetical protein [Ruminiclostridium cellobioparum]|uniref:hypothetical protein n=1 Tax=Ruminiclostridium cellobioparum TaxID=29355 RepID=UPI0006857690|nr:hypothetical protein [Ruminiclostridium cellobioparum]
MHIDQNTLIAIAVVVVGFFTFTYVSMQEIFKFKLKKEQIKVDAMVKAEEIKAKNQLDIEALIHKDSVNQSKQVKDNRSPVNEEDYLSERRNKLDERA